MELTLQTQGTVLMLACSLVKGFICFTPVSSAAECSDRISMWWVICQAFPDRRPLKSRFHHLETWEKNVIFCFLHYVGSLVWSSGAHLQHLSKLSLLHIKRYRLSVSAHRTISLLTLSKTVMTLIISSTIVISGLFILNNTAMVVNDSSTAEEINGETDMLASKGMCNVSSCHTWFLSFYTDQMQSLAPLYSI